MAEAKKTKKSQFPKTQNEIYFFSLLIGGGFSGTEMRSKWAAAAATCFVAANLWPKTYFKLSWWHNDNLSTFIKHTPGSHSPSLSLSLSLSHTLTHTKAHINLHTLFSLSSLTLTLLWRKLMIFRSEGQETMELMRPMMITPTIKRSVPIKTCFLGLELSFLSLTWIITARHSFHIASKKGFISL